MKVTTETGSVYEINTDSKKVRRLEGKFDVTARVGNNEWRTFSELLPETIRVGMNLIIIWGDDVKTKDGGIPTTMTSTIVKIELYHENI